MLVSSIEADDARAELLRRVAVVVWDEATMANHAILACVEETCRKVLGDDSPFGGKTVLLGDFRQTCPVIHGGSRRQVVDASIKSTLLCHLFSIFALIQPIRNAKDIDSRSLCIPGGGRWSQHCARHALRGRRW